MNEIELLIELHKNQLRQGPGSQECTLRAIELAGVDNSRPLKIADLGSGTGASSLTLAENLDAEIIAVDFLQEFLDILKQRATARGIDTKISTQCLSMDALPFLDDEFDVIWSEAAIYNIGFDKGVKDWWRFLKPGGLLFVSELTWLTNKRPVEIEKHWQAQYPGMTTVASNIDALISNGYSPIAHFTLPDDCWTTQYYKPLEQQFESFLQKQKKSGLALSIVERERYEMALYDKYKTYYGYVMYIAKKLSQSSV